MLIRPGEYLSGDNLALNKSGEQWTFSITTVLISLVRRPGLGVRRYAGKQTDVGSNPLRLSLLFKSRGLWTLRFASRLRFSVTLWADMRFLKKRLRFDTTLALLCL